MYVSPILTCCIVENPSEVVPSFPFDGTPKTPLPQQSSSSAGEEEEDHWVLMEDRRRRRVAFENLAKEMLRYPDNSDDVKVGITELQERLEVPVPIVISIQQVAQQARSEKWPKDFRSILARNRRRVMCCQLGQMGGTVERLSRIGKKMSRHKSGNTSVE